MYNSHPSDTSYGNPGFYVAQSSGSVRDSSGRVVDLRPELSERQARRLLIRTSELPRDSEGVYTAKIRKAHNVSAIKLCYASIPRSVSRVTAQLILYSIPIKDTTNLSNNKIALQRLCRNQLLSSNISDFPFFNLIEGDFDWRNNDTISSWINNFEKNTIIPPSLESEISNHYVDIDILTVKVPSMCSLHSLGTAFASVLKSHSGASNKKNNSLWKSFDISVEETGFSVLENMDEADQFTTFAEIIPSDITNSDTVRYKTTRSTFVPMSTPITIKTTKSRSVFVSSDSLTTSLPHVSSSISNMKEFPPTPSKDGDDVFVCNIPSLPSNVTYSLSFYGDVSKDDILEVTYTKVIQLEVLDSKIFYNADETINNFEIKVQYNYGTKADVKSDSGDLVIKNSDPYITISNSTDETKFTKKSLSSSDGSYIVIDEYIVIYGSYIDDNMKSYIENNTISHIFYMSAEKNVSNISEVRRTYQKRRDIRLGLYWGDNKENEDFFIDSNHSLDSPIDSFDNARQRRDVHIMSSNNKEEDDVVNNMMRNIGDLTDTYIPRSNTIGDIYNAHELNDAHQLQSMLFCGNMMNVTAPVAMRESSLSYPLGDVERPTTNVEGTLNTTTKEFYEKGLGWETSIVHAPTRYVMSAFPVRFTEEEIGSIYGSGVNTSISPLVSRILNVTSTTTGDSGYYELKQMKKLDSLFSESLNNPTSPVYYEPRSYLPCGIVATIGNQNYVVKSARLVSILKNETDYTLDLNCDRNKNSESTPLSSINNIIRIKDALYQKKCNSENEKENLDNQLNTVFNQLAYAYHSFYKKMPDDGNFDNVTSYAVDNNAKYFSWVYELDRPVELPTGISHGKRYNAEIPYTNPSVAMRSFNGISDSTAMFIPGVYEGLAGISSINTTQQSAHSFSIRSGSEESENSLLVLKGLGSLERPLNSTHMNPSDVFAVMGSEFDLKKPEKMVCDNVAYMRSPDSLSTLNFHFISSKTGKNVDIGNQNATLVFDIYCSNE